MAVSGTGLPPAGHSEGDTHRITCQSDRGTVSLDTRFSRHQDLFPDG